MDLNGGDTQGLPLRLTKAEKAVGAEHFRFTAGELDAMVERSRYLAKISRAEDAVRLRAFRKVAVPFAGVEDFEAEITFRRKARRA